MNDSVLVTIDDQVAHVRLDRPAKLNALDGSMFRGLIDAAARIADDTTVRAVVLSGNGAGFCAGLDASLFASIGRGEGLGHDGPSGGRPLIERTHGLSNAPQFACMAWHELPVPVIAAIHGVCLGGGLQVALGADLRYVAPDARLSILEIKWGLVPDMGGFVLTRGLVRPDVLRELVYTGRMVSGDEAVLLGLATRVCADPLAEAIALATNIAGRSPDAVRAAKRLHALAADADAATLLLAEAREQQALIGGRDQMEILRAHREKRTAHFDDVRR